jgi:hypothetical protein
MKSTLKPRKRNPSQKPINSRLVRRLFTNRAFNRKIVAGKKNVEEMMGAVAKAFSNDPHAFLQSLKHVRRKVYCTYWRGTPIAIKITRLASLEGAMPQVVEKDVNIHNNALRAGEINNTKYILHTPLVYGVHNGILVMEYISPSTKISKAEKEAAIKELKQNFEHLQKTNPSFGHNRLGERFVLQTADFIVAGKYDGKVVLYTAYDYI